MKRFKALLVTAAVALTLSVCQTTALAESSDYKFEQVGNATTLDEDTVVSVRLVHADESPAANARLYSVRWQPFVPKQGPSEQLRLLEADGHGNFTYSSSGLRRGDTLRLAARVEVNGSLIHGSIVVH